MPTDPPVGASVRVGERFPASRRLRLQADFSRLRERGSRYDCGSFVVNAAPPDAESASAGTPRGFARLGVIATKKMVSNRAVRRNYAKRIFREIFRKNAGAFPAGWDVIVIVRRSFEKTPFARLEARYLEAARRLVSRAAKNAAAAKNPAAGTPPPPENFSRGK